MTMALLLSSSTRTEQLQRSGPTARVLMTMGLY
jgi:hypothetical protein